MTNTDDQLNNFQSNNPHATIQVDDDCIAISKPWGRDDVRLLLDHGDADTLSDLEHLLLHPKFDALFHLDCNTIEFVYSHLDPNDPDEFELIDRSFDLHIDEQKLRCHFSSPTKRLYRIAKCFDLVPTEVIYPNRSVPQLLLFRDEQDETLPEELHQYFKTRTPQSFFVEFQEPIDFDRVEAVARHINFILSYYDRKSPIIEIKQDVSTKENNRKPCLRYVATDFPNEFSTPILDDVALQLIDVARSSEPRFSILYFFQVFEYAGFYYVDQQIRQRLSTLLRDPAVVNCGDETIHEMFSILTDHHQHDDVKMKKVMEEHCDPRILWLEIENDRDFFASEHHMDGGFIITPAISKDMTLEAWKTCWMPALFDQFTKIRNSLVHARERRENRVILPTRHNSSILARYRPLIQRAAEQVALRAK